MTKTRMVRIHNELDDYLEQVSKQTGLKKTDCSRLVANGLKDSELKILKNRKRKRRGFKFEFGI